MFKIALIEDDQTLAKYFAAAFKDDGSFEILLAPDGEEGVKLVKMKKPDLILLDIVMPKMNGLEALKIIKADPTVKDITVIMLSNLSQHKDLDAAKKLGALAFLVKVDMEPHEIVNKVKEYLK